MNRVGQAFRIRPGFARLWIFGKIKVVAAHKVIRFLKNGKIIFIPMGDIGLQVISKGQNTVIIGLCHAKKHHARGRKFSKIDGMTTIFTADGKGHMFCSRCWRWHFPFAQYAQPPDVVAIPIASRGSIVGTNGDKGFTPAFHQLLGNLRA